MNLVTLSLKDLRRRPTRSILTVVGVALASATLFSLLSFNIGYKRSLKKGNGGFGHSHARFD